MTYLTVTQAATRASCNVSYIRAEIKMGRLVAQKIGNQWAITEDEFQRWLSKPGRGNRSKWK